MSIFQGENIPVQHGKTSFIITSFVSQPYCATADYDKFEEYPEGFGQESGFSSASQGPSKVSPAKDAGQAEGQKGSDAPFPVSPDEAKEIAGVLFQQEHCDVYMLATVLLHFGLLTKLLLNPKAFRKQILKAAASTASNTAAQGGANNQATQQHPSTEEAQSLEEEEGSNDPPNADEQAHQLFKDIGSPIRSVYRKWRVYKFVDHLWQYWDSTSTPKSHEKTSRGLKRFSIFQLSPFLVYSYFMTLFVTALVIFCQ